MRGAAKGMTTVMGRVREASREREEFDGLIYFCLMWQNPYFWEWDGKGREIIQLKQLRVNYKAMYIYLIRSILLHTRLEMIDKFIRS